MKIGKSRTEEVLKEGGVVLAFLVKGSSYVHVLSKCLRLGMVRLGEVRGARGRSTMQYKPERHHAKSDCCTYAQYS